MPIPWNDADCDSYWDKKLYLILMQSARQMARCFINSRNDMIHQKVSVCCRLNQLFLNVSFSYYSLFHCHGFGALPHDCRPATEKSQTKEIV